MAPPIVDGCSITLFMSRVNYFNAVFFCVWFRASAAKSFVATQLAQLMHLSPVHSRHPQRSVPFTAVT